MIDAYERKAVDLLKEELKTMHEYHPEYIFLTDCSALPNGFSLKAAWQKAYPKEKAPKFYRIDPRTLSGMEGHNKQYKEIVETFFKKRIKNRDAKILVYDEFFTSGMSSRVVADVLNSPEKRGYSSEIKCKKVVAVNSPELENALHDIKKRGGKEKSGADSLRRLSHERAYVFGKNRMGYLRENITDKPRHPYDWGDSHWINAEGLECGLRAKRSKKANIGTIRYFKSLGEICGKEMHAELEQEKKKKLEHIVSGFLAVGGVLGSLFFIGKNIAGNVVGSLSNSTSSLLGAGLFVVGLVAGFFWLKGRKK